MKHKLILFVVGLAISSTGEPANAGMQNDGTSDQQSESLDEIIVTGHVRFKPESSTSATKFPLPLVETPQSMSILDQEILRATGSHTIGDAVDLAPSMIDADRDVSSFFFVSSRGFNVNPFQGYKINGKSIVNQGFQLDPYVLDRIEFVRGPATIIYGQSDYGSTINSILKKPSANARTQMDLRGDNFGSVGIGVDITGPIVDRPNLLTRIVGHVHETKSFQDLAFKRQVSIAPSMTWVAGDRTTVDLALYITDYEIRDAHGFSLAQDQSGQVFMLDVPKDGFWSADWKRTDGISSFGELRLNHRFVNGLTFDLSAARSVMDHHRRNPIVTGPATETGLATVVAYEEPRNITIDEATATLLGDFEFFERQHTFMVDGFVRLIDNNYFWAGFDNTYAGLTFNLLDPDPTSIPETHLVTDNFWPTDDTEYAISTSLLLAMTDRISLTLGGRMSHLERRAQQLGPFAEQFGIVLDTRFEDEEFTPRVSMTYAFVPDTIFGYFSYSEGIIFQNNRRFDGTLIGPEIGTQRELGLKGDILDGRLGFATAIYEIERTNVAAPDPADPQFSRGLGGQTHRGLEVEVIGQPVPGWNVLASYAYTDVEITDAPNPAELGQTRANTPEHLAKFHTTYEPQRFPRLVLGGGLIHRSEVEVDNVGTFQLPAYTRLDLNLSYKVTENLNMSLRLQNVTDEDILVSFDNSAFSAITFKDGRTLQFDLHWER